MKALLLIILFVSFGCGKKLSVKSIYQKQDPSALYTSGKLNINVYYEEGAEPYTGGVLQLKYWSLLETNLNSLFEGRTKRPAVSVPKELSEMGQLASFNKVTWSADEVLDAAKTLPVSTASDTQNFTVLFLKGFAKEGPGIIGFHISGTYVVAIFKDVIRSAGVGQNELVPKYIEQATLVHEIGHALGLVNNGLDMQEPHQDSAHGAHCNNPDCVMYYSNEGASSMMKFAANAAAKLSIVMFDNQCLSDSRNYKQ